MRQGNKIFPFFPEFLWTKLFGYRINTVESKRSKPQHKGDRHEDREQEHRDGTEAEHPGANDAGPHAKGKEEVGSRGQGWSPFGEAIRLVTCG